MSNRRSFLGSMAALFAAATARAQSMPDMPGMSMPHAHPAAYPHATPGAPVPVITTDVGDLPYEMDNGVKVFRLVAEPVKQTILPGRTLDLWGFNGSAPGPTIQVNRGDRVRVLFENHLPEPISMHWHGFEDTIPNDGVPGISQQPVMPGGRYTYEFEIHQEGTFFYHSHMAMQEMVGLLGGFIMHPPKTYVPRVDKDFLIHLQEYAVLPNNTAPNSLQQDFNWLVFNGRSGPAATPLIVRQGDRVRLRFVNMGMDHHPIHLHGNTWWTTGTEGGRIPQTAWIPGNTQLVGVAQARDVEFDATCPGEWMLHCHMPHHMMNGMVSIAGPMTRSMSQPHSQHMGMQTGEIQPGADTQKLFPQDAMMESLAMAMDEAVAKPENDGLPQGWSGFTQGMMTFVRVLPPDRYDAVMSKMRDANRANDPYAVLLKERA